MSETTKKILKNKIAAIEKALETNDHEFITKWHGNRKYAEKDLEELKVRNECDQIRLKFDISIFNNDSNYPNN